jgi:hypothetical protein
VLAIVLQRFWRAGRAAFALMIHDLITAFLVAFAAVTASELLTRIWEYYWALMPNIPVPPKVPIVVIMEFAIVGAVVMAIAFFLATT